jgi:hypothetical protein
MAVVVTVAVTFGIVDVRVEVETVQIVEAAPEVDLGEFSPRIISC